MKDRIEKLICNILLQWFCIYTNFIFPKIMCCTTVSTSFIQIYKSWNNYSLLQITRFQDTRVKQGMFSCAQWKWFSMHFLQFLNIALPFHCKTRHNFVKLCSVISIFWRVRSNKLFCNFFVISYCNFYFVACSLLLLSYLCHFHIKLGRNA